MTNVVYALAAQRDALGILAYLLDEAGHASAMKFARRFEDVFDRLAANPQLYATRPALGAHVRVATVQPYMIIHRYDRGLDRVTILRILHGKREIGPEFMTLP